MVKVFTDASRTENRICMPQHQKDSLNIYHINSEVSTTVYLALLLSFKNLDFSNLTRCDNEMQSFKI